MTTLKIAYGAETALTWTAAIASSTTVGRECTAVDNTGTLADDYLAQVSIVFPNSAPANDQTVYIFAADYSGATTGWAGSPAVTGSDASYTFDAAPVGSSPIAPALRLAGAFTQVQAKTRVFTIPSIAAIFGGNVPPKWNLVLLNYSGQTLTTVTATYVAITYTNA